MRHQHLARTIEKWMTENDSELNNSIRLKLEMANREHATLLSVLSSPSSLLSLSQ